MKITAEPEVPWLVELETVAEELMNRHLGSAREWFPHQYIPWGQGRDFDGPLGGEPWRPEQSALAPAVRSALVVNLLTEDNLPGYHWIIGAQTGRDGVWGAWLHQWTAEEDRHAAAIRAYLHAARAVDPIALERARMAQVGAGSLPEPAGVLGVVAYAAVQELATRVSHRNTGRLSGDPVCERLLARIAQDENLHMVFYRELLRAALEIDPDPVLAVLDRTVHEFAMPGQGMPGFDRMAAEVAVAGVYDLRVHHDEVLVPLLRSLRIFDLTGLGPAGEQARDRLAEHLGRTDTRAARFVERRAQALAVRARRTPTATPTCRTGEA
ncbi:acyl-[acyl-carrier-protein] desaturase [Kitasatospora gansuensis]|uniref:Acyl-[acyl-carrier-protein] desaturase n=1 Tax=Kitasatospora gansuensis TaxID=258050 RepID=A0A7W7S7E4_9ACTN|nr:acyl-ACP desaturase [Kitasatospora gansuensis]MBB4945235.1 acyl-[acyl-carrier-protein] desaturase [Kitasatospora gansuensis]